VVLVVDIQNGRAELGLSYSCLVRLLQGLNRSKDGYKEQYFQYKYSTGFIGQHDSHLSPLTKCRNYKQDTLEIPSLISVSRNFDIE